MADSQGCALRQDEYRQIRDLAYRYCGIDLHSGKEELVRARLGKDLRRLGLQSYQEYYDHVTADPSGHALAGMIDALTTNHTHFYREPKHFDLLRQLLRDFRARAPESARYRIWSAACATGEEPYSIAFTLREELPSAGAGSVVATDISTRALAVAERGCYGRDRFAGLPVEILRAHLLRGKGKSAGSYRVRKEVRERIDFFRVNLMDLPSWLGSFQVIFCRNVMIYFDQPTQEALLTRLSAHLAPGGYLFIGHSESLNRVRHTLRFVQPAVYRKAAATPAEARR